MPRKHRAKLSTFGPKLFEFWRRALAHRTVAPCASYKAAVRLRFRLYELRAVMREEEHPNAEGANRITLRIVDNEDGTASVIGEPVDAEFDGPLSAAGITMPDAPPLDEALFTLTEEDIKSKRSTDE